MKFLPCKALCLGLSWVAWSAGAYAIPIVPDTVTNQEITRPLNTATPDDYLIDMARATNVNVLADATYFPVPSSVVPYPAMSGSVAGMKGEYREHWNANLINVMGDFVAQEKLSTLRASDRTFLFWSEPDPIALVQAQLPLTRAAENARFAKAVAAQQAAGVPDEEIIDAEASDSEIKRVLLDYLKRKRGWTWSETRQNEKLDIPIPLDELTPDLRALVLLRVQRTWIDSEDTQYFDDDFWVSESLKLRAYDFNGSTVLGVQKDALDDGGHPKTATQHGIANLEDIENGGAPIELIDVAPTTATPDALLKEPKFDDSTMERVYGGISNHIADSILDADPDLQKEISLEAKRLPLREIVAQLQKQSGVSLSLGADAPADKTLTALVTKMPLATFLETLSRVYGVSWEKVGDAYQMRGNQRGELHLQLLQVGDPYRYRFRFMFYNRTDREQNRVALGRAVVKQVGLEALKTPQGVAFESLAKPLQERVKYAIEESAAERMSTMLYQFNALLTQELTHGELDLHFANGVGLQANNPNGNVMRTHPMIFNDFQFNVTSSVGPPEMLQFFVESRDGQLSTPVFELISRSSWQEPQSPANAPGRRRLPPVGRLP